MTTEPNPAPVKGREMEYRKRGSDGWPQDTSRWALEAAYHDYGGYGSDRGQLEKVGDRVDCVAEMVGRLCDTLQRKGLLTPAEVIAVLDPYDVLRLEPASTD